MAGKIQFDRDEAVDQAMRLFWRKGYRHTTMRDLVQATGVRESSLYNTFGGKKELYEAVLEAYDAHFMANMAFCADPESPKESIRNFWRVIASVAADPRGGPGCLYLNVAVELSRNDEEHAAIAKAAYVRIENHFHSLVKDAQAKGEIDASKDARKLARFLTHSMQGLMVAMLTRPDKAFIDDAVEVALSVLD